MPIPTVNFRIQVSGEEAAKKAFRNVQQAAEAAQEKEYRDAIKYIEKKDAADKKALEKKLAAKAKADEKNQEQNERAERKELQDLEAATQKRLREIERGKEREYAILKRTLEREEKLSNPGGSQTGANNGGGGRGNSGRGSGLLEGAALTYLASAAADVFRKAMSPFEQAATDLATAIMGIGGAKSVAENIQQGIHQQYLAKQAMYAVPADQRLSANEITTMATGASNTSVFTREQIMSAIGQYGEISGHQKDLGGGTLKTIMGAAQMTGGDVSQTSGMIAQWKAAFPKISDADFNQIILNAVASGRQGSVGLQDLASTSKPLANAGIFGETNKVKQFQMGSGLIQLTRLVEKSPEEASTSVARLEGEIMSKHDEIAGAIGHNFTHKDKTGQLVMTDSRKSLAEMALAFRGGDFKLDERANSVFKAMNSQVDFTPGMSKQDQVAALQKVIDTFSDVSMSAEQFNTELADLNDTAESKLKQSFNRLNNSIADRILPNVEALIPFVENLTKAFMEYLPVFGDVGDMFKGLIPIGVIFEMLTIGSMALAGSLGYLLEGFIWATKEIQIAFKTVLDKMGIHSTGLDEVIKKLDGQQEAADRFASSMFKSAVDIDQATDRALTRLDHPSADTQIAAQDLGMSNINTSDKDVRNKMTKDFFIDNPMSESANPTDKQLIDNEMKNHYKSLANELGLTMADALRNSLNNAPPDVDGSNRNGKPVN